MSTSLTQKIKYGRNRTDCTQYLQNVDEVDEDHQKTTFLKTYEKMLQNTVNGVTCIYMKMDFSLYDLHLYTITSGGLHHRADLHQTSYYVFIIFYDTYD